MTWLQFKSHMLDIIVILTLLEWCIILIVPFYRGFMKGLRKNNR